MLNQMSRKERRAARKLGAIFVDSGCLQARDPNYGLPVECYVCGAAHKALGVASIEGRLPTTHVPLCDAGLAGDSEERIIRKLYNTPDLEISDGGEVTMEQLTALADKQAMTEH